MARVFLSFLGTNDYVSCIYHRNGVEIKDVRFVQEATIRMYCRDWRPEDRILIFTTKEARKKNWLDNGHVDHNTSQNLERQGLEGRLRALNLSPVLKCVPIPDGQNEEEIWAIFTIVYDQLQTGDEIIFDVTHAFRSIPLLAMVILNYAKVMKDISLGGIYYGAFETLGSKREAEKLPLEKRLVQVLDLTAFDQLLDWSFAIDRFTGAGDGRLISKYAMRNITPLLEKTRGKDESATRLKRMANTLSAFTNTLATCRGPEISEIGVRLKNSIAECREIDLIRPLQPLFSRIAEQTASFQGNMIEDGIQAAKWCLDHNLIQQGVTILRELVFSYAVALSGKNSCDVKTREIASQALTIVGRKLIRKEDQWRAPAKDHRELTHRFIEIYEKRPELVKSADSLGQLRNDMNHAGFGPQAKKVKDADLFRKKLEEAIASMESYLGMQDANCL